MPSQLLLVRVEAPKKEYIKDFEERLLFRLNTCCLEVKSVKELRE